MLFMFYPLNFYRLGSGLKGTGYVPALRMEFNIESYSPELRMEFNAEA